MEGLVFVWSVFKEFFGFLRFLGFFFCFMLQEDFLVFGGFCLFWMLLFLGFSVVVFLKGMFFLFLLGLVFLISKLFFGFFGFLFSFYLVCVFSFVIIIIIKVFRLLFVLWVYLVFENFWERNFQFIQFIRDFLQSDEVCFSEFKSYLGEFRQGLIFVVQYYKSCWDLLGENFQKVFNELLVLLFDMVKQQEFLFVYMDFCNCEKFLSIKFKKNKKSVWQVIIQQVGLDCCVCFICQQVFVYGDVSSYQVLYVVWDDDFFFL